MNKLILLFIPILFIVACTPIVNRQWESTIKIKPSKVPVSKQFLNMVATNWYYNITTKSYGINVGFKTYLTNGLYNGWSEVSKLTTEQFVAIFGQPDFISNDRFLYTYIDLKATAALGLPRSTTTPYVYSGIFIDRKISFVAEGDQDGFEYYQKKFNFKEVDSIYVGSTENCCKTQKEWQDWRNDRAKKTIHTFFFYNKKAGHYICIDGFPLPSSCVSKSEVIRLFGKPSKIDKNGDLLYYISKPNYYGHPNVIKWSPLPNGQYVIDIIIA